MMLLVRLLGYKPKKKKTPPPENKIEKKFKRLLKNGYSIDQARYFSKL